MERPGLKNVLEPIGYAIGIGALGLATLHGDVLPGSMDDDFRDQIAELQAAEQEPAVPESTALPPINTPEWERAANTSEVMAGYFVDSDGVEHIWADDALPETHREAFLDTMQDPVIQLGFEENILTTFHIEAAPYSNGSYDSERLRANLQISPNDTTDFFDERNMASAARHETLHGFSAEWFEYAWSGERTNDPILNDKLDRIGVLCRDYRNTLFADLINNHEAELVHGYRLNAAVFENRAAWELADGDAGNDAGAHGYLSYSEAMGRAATSLEQNDPAILTALAEAPCQYTGGVELLPLIPGNDPTWTREMNMWVQENQNDLLGDIYTGQTANFEVAHNTFRCVNDGEALSDLTGEATGGGHAYDNASEAASSILVTLFTNPNFVARCLDALPEDARTHMLNYIDAIIDITQYQHPELMVILHENPEATAIIHDARVVGSTLLELKDEQFAVAARAK